MSCFNFQWRQVAEILSKRSLIEAVILIRVVLWLLATRLGTFLLCGLLCFSEKWPFINNFSSMSLKKRERVMQWWLKNRFITPIRLAFAYLKVLCLFAYFTWVYFNLDLKFSLIIFLTLDLLVIFIQ